MSGGIVAGDEIRVPTAAGEERGELVVGNARQDRGIGDLVAVEVQDREHRAVAHRVEELVGVPTRRQRPRLGLTVADDARDDEIRIVERGTERVAQRVAELAAFVHGARRLGRNVARDATGKGELPEQREHALRVHRVTDGYVSVYEPSSQVLARIAGPP